MCCIQFKQLLKLAEVVHALHGCPSHSCSPSPYTVLTFMLTATAPAGLREEVVEGMYALTLEFEVRLVLPAAPALNALDASLDTGA